MDRACGCPLLPLKSHIKGPAPVSDQGFNSFCFLFCSVVLWGFHFSESDIYMRLVCVVQIELILWMKP